MNPVSVTHYYLLAYHRQERQAAARRAVPQGVHRAWAAVRRVRPLAWN